VTTSSVGLAQGTRYHFELQDLGGTLTFYIDGVLALTHVLGDDDAAYPWTDVGLCAHNTRDTGSRFTDFTWSHVAPNPTRCAKTIAHRGRIGTWPENSLRSTSLLPPHIYGVECDVQQTNDGEWVLMHDTTVDRTTNGTGNVADLTLAELQDMVLDGGGGMVPTLSDFLDLCQAKAFSEVYIDYGAGSISGLVSLVEGHAVASNCVYFVGSASQAASFRAASASGRIALGSVTTGNVAAGVTAAGTSNIERLIITPGDAAFVTNHGAVATILAGEIAAGASTIDLSETQLLALADGCDWILTDYAHLVNM
jgi:hypothetical protein